MPTVQTHDGKSTAEVGVHCIMWSAEQVDRVTNGPVCGTKYSARRYVASQAATKRCPFNAARKILHRSTSTAFSLI